MAKVRQPPEEPPFDPSRNVLDLVRAEGRRQDDLRREAEVLSRERHIHSREVIQIHAAHARELRVIETKRLDAIREVDVAAASQLANQVSHAAEALRGLVATTAETLARQHATTNEQLSSRITQLERTSYEGSGKAAITDPAMAQLVAAVDALRTNMAMGQGGIETRREGRASISIVAVIIGGFVGLGALILGVVSFVAGN